MSARRDQGLAAAAWEMVVGLPRPLRQEFRSQAMGLGPMLVTSGLAATAAFLAAKAGPAEGAGHAGGGDQAAATDGAPAADGAGTTLAGAYRALADALAAHVLGRLGLPGGDCTALVRELGKPELDAAAYRRASADARAFGIWARRAAEALIPPPRANAGPGDGP